MKRTADIMTPYPACCAPNAPLGAVARLMVQHNCGEVPAVDTDGQLIGVVTDCDIVCRVGGGQERFGAHGARLHVPACDHCAPRHDAHRRDDDDGGAPDQTRARGGRARAVRRHRGAGGSADRDPDVAKHGHLTGVRIQRFVATPDLGSRRWRRSVPAVRAATRARSHGLGLGLSIARKAVWAHGGDIVTRNMPGHGSVFIIDLPLACGGEPNLTAVVP